MPDYPFVVMPHPITSLDEDGLRRRADGALPRVLEILLS